MTKRHSDDDESPPPAGAMSPPAGGWFVELPTGLNATPRAYVLPWLVTCVEQHTDPKHCTVRWTKDSCSSAVGVQGMSAQEVIELVARKLIEARAVLFVGSIQGKGLYDLVEALAGLTAERVQDQLAAVAAEHRSGLGDAVKAEVLKCLEHWGRDDAGQEPSQADTADDEALPVEEENAPAGGKGRKRAAAGR